MSPMNVIRYHKVELMLGLLTLAIGLAPGPVPTFFRLSFVWIPCWLGLFDADTAVQLLRW